MLNHQRFHRSGFKFSQLEMSALSPAVLCPSQSYEEILLCRGGPRGPAHELLFRADGQTDRMELVCGDLPDHGRGEH